MGELAEELKNLIRKRVEDRGIVVWYDPENLYQEVFEEMDEEGLRKFKFEGSLFKLKRDTDFLLEEESRPKAVIYLPLERASVGHALVEYEKAGATIYPGAQTGHNTRLEVLARAVLKRHLPESKAEEVCRQISEKRLNLKETESIIESASHVVPEVLKLLFGSDDPIEVALSFLSDKQYDEEIVRKGAARELASLFSNHFGLALQEIEEPDGLRRELRRSALIGEFAAGLKGEAPKELSRYIQPWESTQSELLLQIPKRWRHRKDLTESYEEAANLTEKEFHLESLKIKDFNAKTADVFHCMAEKILACAEVEIQEGKPSDALDLLGETQGIYWFEADPGLAFKRDFLGQVAELIIKSREISQELKGAKLSAQEMAERYTKGESPWFKLDQLQRKVEQDYEHYEAKDEEESDRLEKIMAMARHSFSDTVRAMADAFQEELQRSGFSGGSIMRQRDIYREIVEPLLEEGKVAYFCVDALRYEMAEQLSAELAKWGEVELRPALATLPTVTGVGMASLLPAAEGPACLSAGGGKALGLKLEGKDILSRDDRIRHLKEKAARETVALYVEGLQRPTRKNKTALDKASLAYVTSQEIDSLCEAGNDPLARSVMEEILTRLRKAVKTLASHGFERIVITADHGYLFGEEVEAGMKIGPPGGKTAELKQRVWIGEGGSASDSFIRAKEKDLGLEGELELAFPRGTGCFKVKGGGRSYFHGGISLQEMMIPVLVLRAGELLTAGKRRGKPAIKLSLDRKKVARYFRVKVEWPGQGAFEQEEIRLRAILKIEGEERGKAIAATQGFDAATEEFTIVSGQENVITVIVDEKVTGRHVGSLHLLDADTGAELSVLEDIEIDITF